MKKLTQTPIPKFLFFLLILALPIGLNAQPTGYCNPPHTSASPCITEFTLNTLTNITAGTCPVPSYTLYPASGSTTTTLIMGLTYTVSGITTGSSANKLSVWIDYDQNGVYDASEWVQVFSVGQSGSASITIPTNAASGLTGMRVRSRLASSPNGATDACTSFGGGETEDYVVNIIHNVPCTAPPTAGAAMISKAFVCPDENFMLNLSGTSIGSGLTYQWEISSDNTNWLPIAGAIQSSLTTSSDTSMYYRCAVTCSGSTAYSSEVQIGVRSALAGGLYTVNPSIPTSGTNFNSITDAVTAINCGITGPIVIDFDPNSGPYNERISLGAISGANSTNTVTFNGNGVALFDTITAGETAIRYLVQLDGTQYVTIDGFKLDIDPASTQGFNIHLTGGASHNIIRNNILTNSLTATTTSYAGIALSGAITSTPTTTGTFTHNIIENNSITGGYYGIVLAGATGGVSKSNRVINNTILDNYSYGIYITGCDSTSISENDISRPTRSNSTTFYGVYTASNAYRTSIEKNRIHDAFVSLPTSTSTFYGVYNTTTDTKLGDFVVKNNLIYDIHSNGAQYGLANNGSDSVQYFNNTIVFDDLNTSTTVVNGFIQTTTACLGVQLMNNIFYITRPGTGNRIGEYWTTTTSTFTSNHNNFYISGGTGTNAVGHFAGTSGTSYATLADWKLSGRDQNSLEVDPQFVNPATGDFLYTNPLLNAAGIPLAKVTDDILGTPRVGNPDIGAYEIPPTPNDMAAIALLSPQEPAFMGVNDIKVRFKNTGDNTIHSFAANWTVNGIPGTQFLYNDTLQPQEEIDTVIASPNLFAGPSEILVWTSNPNGTADSYLANDSVSGNVYICSPFSGNYTIDVNAARSVSNFHSVSDFVDKLGKCGISGTVNVFLSDGVYEEQFVIDSIPGISAANRINFYSLSGDSSLVTITFPSSTGSGGNYIVKLNNAQYISFNNLGFHRSETNTFSTIVELSGATRHISFQNNLFKGRDDIAAANANGTQSVISALDGSNTTVCLFLITPCWVMQMVFG